MLPSVIRIIVRAAAYLWASPYTLLGISIGLLMGGKFRVRSGVIEIHSRRIARVLSSLWIPAMAMTLGHVVLGQDRHALDITRRHERVHVGQYERWGIAFVPAYLACWLVLSYRGRNGYLENPFEIEAYAVDSTRWS